MLELLDGAAQGFNAWRPVAMTTLPTWAVLALAAVLLAALVLAARGLRRASRAVKLVLLGLRLLGAALVLAIVVEPGVELQATELERGRLGVLLDASSSMALADGELTRWQRAQQALQRLEPELMGLRSRYDIEVHRFSSTATPMVSTAQALAAAPAGVRTDIVAALAAVAPEAGQRPLGAVVLISDGADNVALSGEQLDAARPVLAALDAPLLVLPIGAPERFMDVAIEAVLADDFAFVRNSVEVEVLVAAHGLASQRLPLTLREGGKTLSVTEVQVGEGPARAVFKLTPQETGERSFSVELPVLEGEAIAENNRLPFTLDVIRDRIRVLQVAGRPSWDERFLRRLLKANPSVDLISFFILRTHGDSTGPNDQLSLIPFPTDELFTTELSSFDVVILQNFNYRPYHMGQYLSNLRDFVVQHGGGLAMVGGDLSFAEAGYGNTALAEVLAVNPGVAAGQYARAAYRPRLSEAGKGHPILDLGRGPIVGLLAGLPALEGFNRISGLMPGAQILLEHPFERVADGAAPVVAVREVGRGRSLAVLSDDTWYWGLPDAGAGGRGTSHRRFWANALRWLIRDPAMSRVRLEIGKKSYEPGAEVELRMRAFDVGYRPLAGAVIDVQVVEQRDEQVQEVLRKQASAGPDGEVALRLTPPRAGSYRVQVTAQTAAGAKLGRAEKVFVVRSAAPELTLARPRPELLRALARLSGGQVLDGPDGFDERLLKDATRVRVHRAQRTPLWDSLWTLLALCVVLGTEWWLRRRWGFS